MVVRLGQAAYRPWDAESHEVAYKYVFLTIFVKNTYLWSATMYIVLVRALTFGT